eukprot:GHVT01013015.1.p2 GENE.GHVT01013015.1~~GHVT01013015.1.p2  ORF type:complete len:147 (-),score=12.20 GHVT01013015.1:338-778(-)
MLLLQWLAPTKGASPSAFVSITAIAYLVTLPEIKNKGERGLGQRKTMEHNEIEGMFDMSGTHIFPQGRGEPPLTEQMKTRLKPNSFGKRPSAGTQQSVHTSRPRVVAEGQNPAGPPKGWRNFTGCVCSERNSLRSGKAADCSARCK